MTREEAIEIIKRNCTNGSLMHEACEILLPELFESEDERIKKRIRLCLEECEHSDIIRDYESSECIAWLEALRPDGYKNCNSRWEPSEEQMDTLQTMVKMSGTLRMLYNDLKKLL